MLLTDQYIGGFTLAQAGIPAGDVDFSSCSALFDGSSGYVDIPPGPFNLTNALTVVAWVKAASVSHFSGVVGRGDSSWRLTLNASGKPGGDAAHIYADATSSTSIAGANWHLLAYTYSGVPNATNNGLLAVDGVAKATNTVGVFAGNTSDVWIGGSPDYSTARLLAGNLAQVAVFTNTFSVAQLAALYHTGTNTAPVICLSTRTADGGLELLWRGTLWQATNILGPWTTNTSISPAALTPTHAQMFFRAQ
jgi:hypothetical protein